MTRTPELKYGVPGEIPNSAQGRPAGAAAHGTTGSRTAPSTRPFEVRFPELVEWPSNGDIGVDVEHTFDLVG